MKTLLLLLCFPLLALAQPPPLEFQLQPGAFPVSVNNFPAFQPWAGGMNGSTPEFCDIDNDGNWDYFSGSSATNFWFFQNAGTPTQAEFQYESSYFDSLYCLGIGALYQSTIRFCDINGDGLQDVFTSNGIIGYALNQGTPSQWSFPGPIDTLKDQYGNYVIGIYFDLADVNGDGDKDIIGGFQASSDHGLRYYENVSTPGNIHFNLIATAWLGLQIPEGHQNPCLEDLDGDGDLDLLVGTHAGTLRYYRNEGSPTSPQMVLVDSNYLGLDVQEDASPELADIDGDGDLDLFVGRSSNESFNATQGDVFFYRNEGSAQAPNFTYITSNYLAWDNGYVSTPRLVDMNGDGLPDLLSRQGSFLSYYRNTGSPGSPSFTYESSTFGNLNVFDLMPWFVDLNGDGLLDLLAGTAAIPGPPGLKLYLNQGTLQIPNWVLYSSNLVPGVFGPQSVILNPWTADIDADGDQDLFVTDDYGYLYFFQNNGTPTHFQFQYVTNNWQGLIDSVAIFRYGCFYDMDGDGDLDLFMNHDAGGWFPFEKNLCFYRNMGSPQNPQLVLESSDLFPDLMIWQAAPFVIDMDQDGRGDLFVGDTWGGIRFFRNITGENQVNPKRPEGPPERMITLLPNPGNSGTTISYVLDHPQRISLDVYNLLGAKVASLASGLQLPGNYSYTWDASAKASGIYILRFITPDQSVSRKITILK